MSGVDCLVTSVLCETEGSRSIGGSGETASGLTSSLTLERTAGSGTASAPGSPVPDPVPQVTRDFRTVTRQSSPCLLSWFSERPKEEASIDPATDSAEVLSDGGTVILCPLDDVGVRAGLFWSLPLVCPPPVTWAVPMREIMFIRLNETGVSLGSERTQQRLTVHRYCQPHSRRNRSSSKPPPRLAGPHKDAALTQG